MKLNSSQGFTLLELLVVLAIISILAVVALPAYLNYTTRAKVSEGVSMLSGAKTAVMDTYISTDVFPITNVQAGLGLPTDYSRQYVTSVTVGDIPSAGTVTVEIKIPQLGTDNLLQLVPTYSGSSFNWTCQPAAVNGLQAVFVPSSCR